MPRSKHRRKRHNGNKRAQRFFGRTRIWTWEADLDPRTGEQLVVAVARTVRGWERLSGDVAKAVTRHPNNWIICVRALFCDSLGNEWTEEEVRIMRDQRLDDFHQLYHELRARVLEGQRYDQVMDVGWVAATWTTEARDEELSLLDLGASSRARQLIWREVDRGYKQELEREKCANQMNPESGSSSEHPPATALLA